MISIKQLHDNIAPLDRVEPNGVDPRKKIIVIGRDAALLNDIAVVKLSGHFQWMKFGI